MLDRHRQTAALAICGLLVGCAARTAPETSAPPAPARPTTVTPAAPTLPIVTWPQTPPPELVAAAPPARPVATAPPAPMSVVEAQRRLTQLGYRPGAADGQPGPRTTAALRLFQRDQRLKPSGELDADTIDQLRNARRR